MRRTFGNSRPVALDGAAILAIVLGLGAPCANAQTAAGTAATAPADADSSGNIVVTARKRSERIEDIPLTLDLKSGQMLQDEGVLRPSQLQFAVPGFVVENYETRATITMRGVGAQIDGGTSSVATHIDGIYQASSAAQLNRMFDVERVEVLKGPQGTLYGRNSTGGALNIITKSPGSTLEGDLTAGYGSYNTVHLDGGLSVPLSNDWSVRVAGSYLKGDGQYFNLADDKKIGRDDYAGGRATLAGHIGDVTANVFVQYSVEKDNRTQTLIPINPASALPVYGWNVTVFDNPLEPLIDRKLWMAGVNLSGKFSDTVSWKSITGFLDYHDVSNVDVNPVVSASQLAIQTPEQAREYTQEFQILYKTSHVDAVFGAFYMSDRETNQRYLELTPPGLLLFNNSGLSKTDSAAFFTDVTYSATDKLSFSAGGRINHEGIRNAFTGLGLLDGASFDISNSQTSATWKLGTQYTLEPGFLLFGTISTGFQAGFSETKTDARTGANDPTTVLPEKLTSYEVGLKRVLPNHLGFFNLSAFFYDYRDMQVSVGGLFLNPDGTLNTNEPAFFYTANAGLAHIYGLDFQLVDVRLAPMLKFDASGEYLHARFLQYDSIDNNNNPVSYNGHTLPRAPEFTATGAITIDHIKLASNAVGEIRGELNYRSRNYFTPDNTSLDSQGPLALINANAKVDFDGGKWSLFATGRNLANRHYFDYYGGSTFGTCLSA